MEESREVEVEVGWIPEAGVVAHAGDPIPPDADFFAPPPPEIGPILSAQTTLRLGRRPRPAIARLALAGFAGSTAVALLGMAPAAPEWPIQAAAFAVPAALAGWLTRFAHACSYVGRDGVARFRCSGTRERVASEVFRFEDAAELRVEQTRHYHNGVYTGTSYAYRWSDIEGEPAFRLTGTHRGKDAPPKPKDAWHLADAAERAWTDHLLRLAPEELSARGALRFGLGRDAWVDLGPGYVECRRKGATERWSAGEIASVDVHDGVIKVKRVGAREGWFRSEGVWSFPWSSLANARFFLLAAPRLLAAAGAAAPSTVAEGTEDEPVLELD